MKKILITFSGAAYDFTTQYIARDGCRLGADEVKVYDDKWLMQHEFSRLNKWLYEHPGRLNPDGTRTKLGCGWYAFKPLIILDAMSKIGDGDIVMYCDADSYPIADLSPLFEICDKERGICVFAENGCVESHWTKEDVFWIMGQEKQDRNQQHATARWMLFQKGSYKVQQFLYEWLTYVVNPHSNTIDPSFLRPEHDGYVENRSDQSVFSLLCHKYRFPLHRACDAAGENSQDDRDKYGLLFNQIYCKGDREDLSGSRYRTEGVQ